MKIKKAALILTALAAALVLFTGCSRQKKTIINVGVSDNIVNWSFKSGKSENHYGAEMDFLNYLGEENKNLEFRLVSVDYDTREQKLLDGKIDCILSLFSITDERKEKFDLSEPYYSSPTILMVENSAMFNSISDLSGKRIGVLGEDSIPAEQLLSRFDRLRLKAPVLVEDSSYDSLSEQLEEGQIEAICFEEAVAYTYGNKERSILSGNLGMQSYAMAFRKDDPLTKDLLTSANRLAGDPRTKALFEAWGFKTYE